MEATQLNFVLEGAGWARIEISADSFSHTIDGISYISDALDDLLRMGIDIATDKGWSAAEFEHEPGSTVLVAETAWWDGDAWGSGPRLSSFRSPNTRTGGVTWKMVHEADRDFILPLASRDELARLFLETAKRVLSEHGEEGYRKAWGGRLEFPIRALKALEAALNQPAKSPFDYQV